MLKPQESRHILVRVGLLLASGLTASYLTDVALAPTGLKVALACHALSVLAGALIPARKQGATVRLTMLALDLVCLVGTACMALVPLAPEIAALLPFLTAYLVATLVAFVGARATAGAMGGLAGMMVLGMGLLYMQKPGAVPELMLLIPQVLWVLMATALSTVVAVYLERQAAWMKLSRSVERELKAREAEAAELVSFTQALSDSASLDELADAVLRHVRVHLGVRARAVFLESDGDELAIWEETGRLEHDHVERRRVVLQKALVRNGSNAAVRRLQARSVGSQDVPSKLDYHTVVDIPVRVGGRVAGVVFLADPKRGALPQDRIGMLADVARRTGEAVGRIERRKVQENRRTSLLLRQMREGVLLLGPDGKVLLANPAAKEALAQSRMECGENTLGEVSLDDLGRTPPGISRRFRARIGAADGDHPRELACTAVGIMDNGQRVGTLVTVSDITDEELARRRLLQAEKSTLVGQTLAGVAHELNNPLAALIGYADLLENHDVPADIEKPVRKIREQATRATRIVRNLLNFARRKNPQRTPTKMQDLVDATIELFAYEARMANVEVTCDIPDDLPAVLADKHSLQQILVNLTQNALHAMSDWDAERKLKITGRELSDSVVLRVRDSGPGVPEDLRAKVFNAFFTTKGSANGTGLGLALSVSIARDHGGDLFLEPDDGSGACFVLRLPLPTRAAAMAHVAQGGGERIALPGTILVVDDEPSVRESLVAQLGNLGSRVDSAANATEAQRLLRHQAYDVVLTDVRMPGMSGLELHKDVGERNPTLAERFVFMTGDFVNDEIRNDVMKTGNSLLEKPFTLEELSQALGNAAQKSKIQPGYTITN
ncbi:MAG: response regulator [Planctomycetota bacterium]|nr:response regulator [Planctomycetota bacterium]